VAFIRGPAQFRLRRGRCEATMVARLSIESGARWKEVRVGKIDLWPVRGLSQVDRQAVWWAIYSRRRNHREVSPGVRRPSPFSPSFQIYHGWCIWRRFPWQSLKRRYCRTLSAKSCKPQADGAWACVRFVLLLPFSAAGYLSRAPRDLDVGKTDHSHRDAPRPIQMARSINFASNALRTESSSGSRLRSRLRPC
jgi:hypothetical protein